MIFVRSSCKFIAPLLVVAPLLNFFTSSFLSVKVEAAEVTNSTEKPGATQDKPPDMAPYMEAVKHKIQAVWRSPDVQKKCTVSILFSVEKNGALSSAAVKKSSGFPNVDQIALQAIKKSAPFPELPEGTGKFSVEYAFECGPHKTADAYLFNGVPIKNQEYKVSSGGATLRDLDTNSAAERKLQQRAALLKEKADALQSRLTEIQGATPVDNAKLFAVTVDLANTRKQLQQYDQAEGLYKSAIALEDKVDNQVARLNALFAFANLYYVMGKYVEAEPLYERAMSLQDAQHPNKELLSEYAKALYKLNKPSKADDIYKQLRGLQ